MGRFEEAIHHAQRARRLAPVMTPWARMNLGTTHYFARDYHRAVAEFEEILALDKDYGPAHTMLGRVYSALGEHDKAVGELERARKILGTRPDVIAPHAYVLARAGRTAEALAVLDEL